MLISTLVGTCLYSFNIFVKRLGELNDDSVIPWQDELGRLRVWTANIGAHQQGQLSLDCRLRDASHIREQVVQLLRDLGNILEDAKGALLEESGEGKIDETIDNNERSGDGSRDIEVLEAGEDADALGNELSEMKEVYEEAVVIINCLYQMSMVVRQPVRHDRIMGSSSINTSYFEAYDRDHVRYKFPKIGEKLAERLGMAITKRRRYFQYRERHHAKLAHGLEADDAEAAGESSTLSPTMITVEQDHRSAVYNDALSENALSQTTYGSILGESHRSINIPRPPKGWSPGVPFECPYCYFLIEIKHEKSWARHVFRDLQPYICIAQTCTTPNMMFESRHEWFNHEIVDHQDEWLVSSGESSTTTCSVMESTDTLKVVHEAPVLSPLRCPLCFEKFSSRQFEKHAARHLEELALFALPLNDSDGGDEEETIHLSARSSNAENEGSADDLDGPELLPLNDSDGGDDQETSHLSARLGFSPGPPNDSIVLVDPSLPRVVPKGSINRRVLTKLQIEGRTSIRQDDYLKQRKMRDDHRKEMKAIGGACLWCTRKRKGCDTNSTCSSCEKKGRDCIRGPEKLSLLETGSGIFPGSPGSIRPNREAVPQDTREQAFASVTKKDSME